MSYVLAAVGAICFGLVAGYITYRTLVRQKNTAVSDIAAVISALGGGTVTTLFSNRNADMFSWYAIGLLAGMVVFFVAARRMMGKEQWALVMGDAILPRAGNPAGQQPSGPQDPQRPR